MDDLTQTVISASTALITLTSLAIGVRIWARGIILRTIGLDDALILASWLRTRVWAATVVKSITKTINDTLSSITYSWGVPLAKMSFAVLYLRLLPERGLHILNKCLVAFLFAQAVEETLVVLLKCSPISKSWEPNLDGTCLSLVPLWYITFVFNLATDLILFIEPIPSMWKLQMPLAKKVGIIAMLSLGLLVSAISVIRIKFVSSIGQDDTFELAEPLIWSQAEICALIICSCIPSLRQVAARIPGLNGVLGLSSGKDSRSRYPHSSRRSKAQSRHRSTAFGMTSRAEATPRISDDGRSTDGMFSHKSDQKGGIMVTNEVIQAIESSSTSLTEHNGVIPHHLARSDSRGSGSMH
ncbi:hypothetical protein BJ170DRAFT_677777 [Xylariales sp. AK1849]|nr:hypothetical protein BJ170DRAFT_677777 [Xylariales sp. AK1849]